MVVLIRTLTFHCETVAILHSYIQSTNSYRVAKSRERIEGSILFLFPYLPSVAKGLGALYATSSGPPEQ